MTSHNLHSLLIKDTPEGAKLAAKAATLGWSDDDSYIFRVVDIPPTVTNSQVLRDVDNSNYLWADPDDTFVSHSIRYSDLFSPYPYYVD